MNSKILYYSLDKEITISKLKEKSDFDGCNFLNIENILSKYNINGIMYGENDFHYKFLTIKFKPYIIYYKGNLDILNKKILGIVGPRKNTEYSNKVLEYFFQKAQNYDLATVSGMAIGIDQLCHNLSIKHNIPTIAILGGGLHRYLNTNNRHIINKITDNGGLVISEYKLSMKPTNYSFPQRNRIIAGLSDILFLPEAGEDSGSLITVNFAIKMQKQIYGTPNDIFSDSSKGINKYIAEQKIKLISDFDLFLLKNFQKKSNLKISYSKNQNLSLSENEKKILSIISKNQSISIGELSHKSSISSNDLLGLLTMLEINKLIYQDTPDSYKISQ